MYVPLTPPPPLLTDPCDVATIVPEVVDTHRRACDMRETVGRVEFSADQTHGCPGGKRSNIAWKWSTCMWCLKVGRGRGWFPMARSTCRTTESLLHIRASVLLVCMSYQRDLCSHAPILLYTDQNAETIAK